MTYIERTKADIEALETALRTHFKAAESPPIPFSYNGVTYDIRDRETRMLLVAAIQDAYYQEHAEFNQRALDDWYAKGCRGERPSPVFPDAALMDRLTDAVLNEEITDPNPHKIAQTEYPFMSERQLDLRRDREASEWAAKAHGSDGKDYREPTKRKRTAYENYCVEKNAQRSAQYKRDTAAGPVLRRVSEPFTQCIGLGRRWAEDMGAMNEVIVERAEETPLTLPVVA
ncbi:hypothetical protein [Paenibacillus tuaregi]|uniref:hypothetical protein n=1 Tax=Paenibacillus tuaregi TaxID=1816681 RepID=UPI000837F03A|nr:hypothetical protein [Paenibacillus tuaregi]